MAWDVTKVTLGNPTRKSDHDQLIDNLIDLAGSGRTTETVKDNADDIAGLAGVIIPFGGTSAPSGYLLCDGSNLLRASYAALFAVIGTAFGTEDGTHFNIPDLRGYFLRGRANGQTTDPDRATRTALQAGGNTGDNVGSKQITATKLPTISFTTNTTGNHRHSMSCRHGGANYDYIGDGGDFGGTTKYTNYTGNHSHSVNGGGDNESRPINVYVNYIIKY